MNVQGIWLPIITPFHNGEVDYQSYENLIQHYLSKGITGIIPLGTTGECPTINDQEFEKIVEKTVEVVQNQVPIYVGLGGNDTGKLVKKLKFLEKHPVEGILSVCPYYNRPNQRGLYEHFLRLSEATTLDILLYNIPYRTGVNMSNETVLRLSEHKNIVGIKDACGDLKQSLNLLAQKPENFSILTGEDALLYPTLVHGGDGGVLASCHLRTEEFMAIYNLVKQNDHQAALKRWNEVQRFIPLMFKEPNPSPLKFCLMESKLIRSDEVRMPLLTIEEPLQKELKSVLHL